MKRAVVGLLVLAVLVLVGCGIPTDDEPRVLADETTTTNPDADPEGSPNTASVYLVDDDNVLVATRRALDGERSPATVLDALLASQSSDEEARGLTSRIPAGTTRVGAELEDGLVTVDLSQEWLTLGDPYITTANAQVVFTLSDLPGVDQVRFRVDGRDIQAQTPNRGPLDVVTVDDYPVVATDDDTTGTDPDG